MTTERRTASPGVLAIRAPALDAVRPMDAAERLRGLPGLALLESARPGRNARWTYLSADPVAVLDTSSEGPDPFATARRTLARLDSSRLDSSGLDSSGRGDPHRPPFAGGLIGYLSYDLGRRLETMPSEAEIDQDLPILRLALHDWVVAWDRRLGQAWLAGRAVDGRIDELLPRLAAVRARLMDGAARRAHVRDRHSAAETGDDRLDDRLDGSLDGLGRLHGGLDDGTLVFRSGLSRARYEAGVRAVRAEIERGEIYQANLSRRLETAFRGDPWPLYRRLRTGDPALFAAYLDIGASPTTGAARAVLSASPEPFLSVTSDGRVATDPIKGTRPRGLDPADDRRLAHELLASTKDRAENVMIVDVLRNDLGRVCVPGSVRVPRLCRLERTAAVQHLVSTVTGQLGAAHDPFDLLAAAFPGGSITGAPKIRAMQLLEGLEPVRRGPYTGAAGWIGPDGAMQTSILIRTFVADGSRLTLHVGGGITWRSDPAAEWEETVAKARGPLGAIDGHEVAA